MERWKFDNQEDLESQEDVFDLRKVVGKLLDNWVLILSCLVVALVIAFLVNRYTTPIYIISSNLLVKSEKEVTNAVSDLLFDDEFFGRNSTNIDNEAALLKSYKLIRATLEDLGFNVSYFTEGDVKDDELYKKTPIFVTVDPNSTNTPYGVPIKCVMVDSAGYYLESKEETGFLEKLMAQLNVKDVKETPINKTKRFTFGQPVDLNGFKFVINRNSAIKKKYPEIFFKVDNYQSMTKKYRGKIQTEPYSIESSILTVSMEGSVPEKVIDFINRLIDNFVITELERKNYNASKTIEFIDRQVKFTGDSLTSIEKRLERFKESNTAIDLTEKGTRLNSQINSLLSERASLSLNLKYLNDLRDYINNNNLDQIIPPSSLGLDEPTLNTLVQQLMNLQSEIKIMESDRNLENPLIRLNRQKINSLKNSILDNINSLEVTTNFRLNDVSGRMAGVQSSLRNLPAAERELVNIQRTKDISEELYLFLMQKKAEAGIAKATNTVDYRIIDAATVKGVAPVKPSPILNYMVAIALGLAFPTIIIFLNTLINNKVTSSDELNKLSTIPLLGSVAHNKYNRKSNNLITVENPKSAISESFRTIRSNLRYLSNGVAKCRTFLITSSISGEGKSFCANNLAYIFSNFGKKVLLVNADMRKHYSYEAFGLEAELGLSDFLAGIASKDQVIRNTKFRNLQIITSGGIPPNPSELLISGKLDALLDEAKKEFDYIILDTPPIGLLADSIELMRCSDVNLYVVRQNYTLKSHINDANEVYQTHKAKNMALLLNDVNYKKLKYGYGYYSEDVEVSWWKGIFK